MQKVSSKVFNSSFASVLPRVRSGRAALPVALSLSVLLLASMSPAGAAPEPAKSPKEASAVNKTAGAAVKKATSAEPKKADKPGSVAKSEKALGEADSGSEAKPISVQGQAENADQAGEKEGPLDKPGASSEEAAAEETKEFKESQAVQHFNAARSYLNSWEPDLAELELRSAIMYMPKLKIAHRDYCLVAMMRGKPLRALAEFMMVVGLGDPVPLRDNQRQMLVQEASKGHYDKALKLAKKGKWDDAISEFMWAKTYTPNDPAVLRSLAFAFASKGDFKMAEDYYSRLFQLNPDDAFAHADFAFLLSDKGQSDKAVQQLQQAVKLRPDAAALHVDLGWLAQSKGDYSEAEKEFRDAVELSPKHPALWSQLGLVLEKEGRVDEARSAFKKALALDPQHISAREGLSQLDALGIKPSKVPEGAGMEDSTGASQKTLEKPEKKVSEGKGAGSAEKSRTTESKRAKIDPGSAGGKGAREK